MCPPGVGSQIGRHRLISGRGSGELHLPMTGWVEYALNEALTVQLQDGFPIYVSLSFVNE